MNSSQLQGFQLCALIALVCMDMMRRTKEDNRNQRDAKTVAELHTTVNIQTKNNKRPLMQLLPLFLVAGSPHYIRSVGRTKIFDIP